MIVSDTNLLSYFWLESNFADLANLVHEKDSFWIAPMLWKSEFRNVLTIYLRREIYTYEQILTAMKSAEEMMEGSTYQSNSDIVLELVSQSTCSAYDCEFVALAKELGIPLLTFDKKVLKEFPTIAIHPEEFLRN